MSTTIDRRMASRRRAVVEHGARRRLRRLLVLLGLVGLGGFTGWMLYHSPLLAVSEVRIGGAVESRAVEIVADAGVAEGVPTINVRSGAIEAALLQDPWIAAASVRVTWPGTVEVEVLERAPAAWIEAGESWLLADPSGVVLEVAQAAPEGEPTIAVGSLPTVPGEAVDRAAVAAVEFLQALPENLVAGAAIAGSEEQLSAVVGGHRVVLGYPSDMRAKAGAVAALLAAGIDAGSEINVVSPERPAVNSRPQVETLEEVIGEAGASG